MKTHVMIGAGLVVFVSACAAFSSSEARQPGQPGQDDQDVARPQRDSLSYGVGYYLGREVRDGLRMDDIDANFEQLLKGFDEGLQEHDPSIPEDELDAILYAVHKEMQARMVKRLLAESPEFKKLYDSNRLRSQAFLDDHASEEGVITLPSGVQYKEIEKGEGRMPGLDDTIVVSYRGTLVDGTVINEGRNIEVEVNSVVEGGVEVLQMMQEGDKWEVALPPEMAFGEAGDSPLIGPNESLLFEVQLHSIK